MLVRDIRDALGPSSGIDSDDVDENDLLELMRGYISRESDWRDYALGDPSRNYTRNLVDEGNGNANLLILVWTPGKGSLVHDHANAHCTLVETLYDWPDQEVCTATSTATTTASKSISPTTPLKIRKSTTLERDDVAYISDKIGLHRMSNPSMTTPAVSLHLYTPPYAAKFGCNMYDERTGKATHIKLNSYFSKYGRKGSDGFGCVSGTKELPN
ncbi:cysteine dioxygenase type I family protein [Peziza echinospora]|nr:cysteine dioxygenase type I family protein [Peziza echinospora]